MFTYEKLAATDTLVLLSILKKMAVIKARMHPSCTAIRKTIIGQTALIEQEIVRRTDSRPFDETRVRGDNHDDL